MTSRGRSYETRPMTTTTYDVRRIHVDKVGPMTFSIVARSEDGRSWGVAVASKFLAVGSAVPAAVAGVGAVATQAEANVAYKGLALSPMDEGATAEVALQRRLEEDPQREHGQVGLVDVDGTAPTHTGRDCFDWAGGV